MSGATTRGFARMFDYAFRGVTRSTSYYVALVNTLPTFATKTLGQLTESSGSGYTAGGYPLTPGSVDFPTLTESDAVDTATLYVKDLTWVAGADINARYAVLLNHHATPGSREIMGWADLSSARVIRDTQALTLSLLGFRLGTPYGFTNRGFKLLLDYVFRAAELPSNLYLALASALTTPSADFNTFGQFSEAPAGNGYTTGGSELSLNSTDFATVTENDVDGYTTLALKNIVWTASGGSIPASGLGARYAPLTTDDATIANREVLGYFDLEANSIATTGLAFTITTPILKLAA